MKNRRFLHIANVFLVLTAAVFLLSWIGAIYSWDGVRSLMRVEGLRWFLRTVQDNFMTCPVLAPVLVMFFGIGPWIHSGLGNILLKVCSRKNISRKDKYSLVQTFIVGAVYILIGVILVFGPWNIAKSSLGSWHSSPISIAIWFVCSLGIGIMGVVYGFLSENYRTDRDIITGLSYCYRSKSFYFITLFLISQFFNSLLYTRLYVYAGLSYDQLTVAYIVVSLLPLLMKDHTAEVKA